MADDEKAKTEPLWMRLLLWLSRSQREPRETLLTVSRKWLPFCGALIAVLTFGWTWIIHGEVVAAGEHHGVRDIIIAVVNETAKAAALIALYAVSITYVLDIAGGIIMVTARYLTDKFVEPLRERLREEGRAEGRAEIMDMVRKWEDWNKRRMKAEDEGIPFDEPPPASSNGRNDNGHRSISD